LCVHIGGKASHAEHHLGDKLPINQINKYNVAIDTNTKTHWHPNNDNDILMMKHTNGSLMITSTCRWLQTKYKTACGSFYPFFHVKLLLHAHARHTTNVGVIACLHFLA
jgi:hypothetical protein